MTKHKKIPSGFVPIANRKIYRQATRRDSISINIPASVRDLWCWKEQQDMTADIYQDSNGHLLIVPLRKKEEG